MLAVLACSPTACQFTSTRTCYLLTVSTRGASTQPAGTHALQPVAQQGPDSGQNDSGKEGVYLTSGSISNYLVSNLVGNSPLGAFGEENAVGFRTDGIPTLVGANNDTDRRTLQIGDIAGASEQRWSWKHCPVGAGQSV